MDCAALCVVEWPHGDDAGAGRGRRGRELRDQRWVQRRLPCEPDASIFRFSACSANGLFRWMVLEEGCVPVHVQGNRAEPRIETGLHGDRAGACQDGRRRALQRPRWVRSVAATLTICAWRWFLAVRGGPCSRMDLRERFIGFAAAQRCTLRRRTATRRRRWRWSRRARTCAARPTTGTIPGCIVGQSLVSFLPDGAARPKVHSVGRAVCVL